MLVQVVGFYHYSLIRLAQDMFMPLKHQKWLNTHASLLLGNPALSERITVIKGKVEEVELPEKADILISEPMCTLLVNERLLESYVIARDRFLVPSGKIVSNCWEALFWQQHSYYGVDLTPLHGAAFRGYFLPVCKCLKLFIFGFCMFGCL